MDICEGCLAGLALNHNPCKICGLSLPEALEEKICGSCLNHPPGFNLTIAPFIYQPPISQLIQQLKFQGHLHVARLLGELLLQRIHRQPSWDRPEAIVPVPLHKQRLKERGFNQAMELARPIARQLDIPIVQACQRVRHTQTQMGLSAKERHRNIRGAFSVNIPRPLNHVAILDDVYTTGQTLTEMTKTLKRAGIKQVQVWVCARVL
jgi:ComF family protein